MGFQLMKENWLRDEYFEHYLNHVPCTFSITVKLDITAIITSEKKLYPTMLYYLTTIVNRHKEFRMSFNKAGQLGFFDKMIPCYTIFHKDDHTFSDIWSEYNKDFSVFYKNCVEDMETWKDVKGVKTKPGKPDNFTPISCIPWLSYTSQSYDTPMKSPLLFPIVLFGKYFEQNGEVLLPFSAYLQHLVADGYHTSLFINTVQEIAENYEHWLPAK